MGKFAVFLIVLAAMIALDVWLRRHARRRSPVRRLCPHYGPVRPLDERVDRHNDTVILWWRCPICKDGTVRINGRLQALHEWHASVLGNSETTIAVNDGRFWALHRINR